MDLFKRIEYMGVLPVIKISDVKNAAPLAKALRDGGLNAAEITFRTACAKEAIKTVRELYPDMLIAAGTVLTPEQADSAMEAGADFVVSPGFNPTMVCHCLEKGYPVVPGCSSPSDVEAAMAVGLKYVKFFPAEAAGGIAMIKAMSGPYGGMKFMPTGGINKDNLNAYLANSKVFACGGSFMVNDKLIESGNFAEITRLTREAVDKMLDFKLAHIGINASGEAEAKECTDQLSFLFGFGIRELPVSYFAGPIEIMKNGGRGTHGHIAVSTPNVGRAMYFMEQRGFRFDESSIQRDASGEPTFAYVENDFLGFRIHLVKA